MPLQRNGKLPTCAEYYASMIDSSVDLVTQPKQCCPFHAEKTPSFSYEVAKDRWRCFGKCHTGGDVYDMHKMKYQFQSREEAVQHLNALCGIVKRRKLELAYSEVNVSDDKVEDEAVYSKCLLYADCPERWLDLDYVMSKTPVDSNELHRLLNKWGVGN